MTGLYDIVMEVLQQLKMVTKSLEETKDKLNETGKNPEETTKKLIETEEKFNVTKIKPEAVEEKLKITWFCRGGGRAGGGVGSLFYSTQRFKL